MRVKVSKDAGRCCARCANHLLYITARRICYSIRRARDPWDRELCPPLLAGLERLRAWAIALADEEVFASWERKGLGGQPRKILHLDSAMCWDSCLELCEDGVRLRQDMVIIKDYMPDLPELLTQEHWAYIEANIVFLSALRAASSILQPRLARAAQILSVTFNLITGLITAHDDASASNELRFILALARSELERVVDFHFKTPFQHGSAGVAAKFEKVCRKAGARCCWDFLRLAAFCAVGPDSDLDLADEDLRNMLEKCCLHVGAPETLDDADGSAQPAVPLVAAAPARPEKIKGRAVAAQSCLDHN